MFEALSRLRVQALEEKTTQDAIYTLSSSTSLLSDNCSANSFKISFSIISVRCNLHSILRRSRRAVDAFFVLKSIYHKPMLLMHTYQTKVTMKSNLLTVLFFILLLLPTFSLRAQVPGVIDAITAALRAQDCDIGPDNRRAGDFAPSGTRRIHTGDATSFSIIAGADYTFKTCNTPFNNKVTLHREIGTVFQHITTENGDGCNGSNNGEDFTWSSGFTGRLWITITDEYCLYNSNSAILYVEQNDNVNIQAISDQSTSCGGTVTFSANVSLEDNPSGVPPAFTYQWYRRTGIRQYGGTGIRSWAREELPGQTNSSLTMSNIQPDQFGQEYFVVVTLGNYSENSNPAKIIENSTDPPSGLQATEDLCNSEVELEWQWYMANPSKFLIEYVEEGETSWSTLEEVSGTDRRYTHEGVERGLIYQYRMRTFSDACGSYTNASSVVEGISPIDPTAPSYVRTKLVDAPGGQAIEVSWQDNSDNEDGFFISKISENGNEEQFRIQSDSYVKETSGDLLRHIDTDAQNCDPYTYRVYAYNVCAPDGIRNSQEEDEVTLTVPIDSVIRKEALEASHGYYPDRTSLSWQYEEASNYRYVTGYRIYSREIGSSDLPDRIQDTGKETFDWNTDQVKASTLYEYFLLAVSLCGNEEILSYPLLDSLSGVESRVLPGGALVDSLPQYGVSYAVGFRSPAGLIHGNITYIGGIAVPDVKVSVSRSSGPSGRSLYFDGNDDYILIDPSAYLDLLTDSFSIAMWIKPEVITSDMQFVATKTESFILGTTDRDVIFYANDGSLGWTRITAADVLSQSQYTHITVTYHMGDARIYINGKLSVTQNVPRIPKRDDRLFLGGLPWGGNDYFFEGYVDEVRLFSTSLDSVRIFKDYNRYISANAPDLLAYWRMEEGAGPYVFDLARSDDIFHQNDGRIYGAQWAVEVPTEQQLGMAGYTNSAGNYTVSGIFYTGVGESFEVTPTITLAGAVHEFAPSQRLEFVGESSSIINNIDFEDVSSFRVTGQVVFNYNGVQSGSAGVGFYIDGTMPVVNTNGQLITTGDDGNFDIQLPIGLHSIVVRKAYHEFENNGKWPTLSEKYNFQEPVSGIIFMDTTRRKLVGRVVGGLVEGEMPLGFHLSTNNIGQARFILRSQDGTIEQAIMTNPYSGEFSAKLPPKRYTVFKGALPTDPGISVNNNPDADIYFSTLPEIDLSNVFLEKNETNPVYSTDPDPVLLRTDSITYNLKHSFIYRSIPRITVRSGEEGQVGQPLRGEDTYIYKTTQGSQDTIELRYGQSGGTPFPVFKKLTAYKLRISLVEDYTNLDVSSNPINSLAPVTDGSLTITNYIGKGFYEDENKNVQYYGIGAPGSSPDIIEMDDPEGDTIYMFIANEPENSINTADRANSFTRSMQITAQAGGNVVHWPGPGQIDVFRAYVFGTTPIGSSFITQGPDMVDFILRDPPGSNSSTELSNGETMTKTHTVSVKTGFSSELEVGVGAGTKMFIGGGLGVITGVINEVEILVKAGFSFSLGLGYNGEWVETYTTTETFGTSDDEDFVGAEGDVFIGKSQNFRFGVSQSLALVPENKCPLNEVVCPFDGQPEEYSITSNSGVDYQIGSKAGFFLSPEGTPTFFIYTQKHIEEELIPSLNKLRNTIMLENPKYSSKVSAGHDLYAENNDDPRWPIPTSSYPETHDEDFDGLSYTFFPAGDDDVDSIRWYNQQIRIWREALAQNEKAKVDAYNGSNGDNKSFSAGASYTSETRSATSSAHSVVFETALGVTFGSESQFSIFGAAISLDFKVGLSLETGYSYTNAKEDETTFTYTLSDGDEGDFYSVDVYPGENDNSPIFIIKDGGESSCPHEGAFVTKYYQPGTALGSGTLQRTKPRLEIAVPTFYNVPSDQPAVYTVILYNDSESMDERPYILKLVQASNPDGASVTIDGRPVDGEIVYKIPANVGLQKTMLVDKGPYEYSYENIAIEMQSACDDDINTSAGFSAYFSPTCTDIDILVPQNEWVLNSSFNDTLSITMGSYNINYAGLASIDLKYKPSAASNWILLETFYKDTTGMNDPDLQLIPRDKPTTTYYWDVSQLPDAPFDIMVESSCSPTNIGTIVTNESEIFSGLMDRVRPHAFGRPQPADAVLSPSDEILIQFNEPINIGVLSPQNFDLRGVLNGGDLRHPASVLFDGDENHYIRVGEGAVDLSKKSFTIDLYARRATNNEAVLISQGETEAQSLEIGFNASHLLYFRLGDKTLTSLVTTTDNHWHHYAITYNQENGSASISRDAVTAGVSNNFSVSYQNRSEFLVGKSALSAARPFTGNIHELRIWNRVLTEGQIAVAAVKRMSRANIGLIANWRMEEGTGSVAREHIRSKHADVYADWQLEPSGRALYFNGNQYAEVNSPGFLRGTDFSIEFWFRSDEAREVCFLSNGRGDAIDLNIDSWAIGATTDGNIFVHHGDTSLQSSDKNYHDGNWHHLALVVSRIGNTILYVDSEQLASARSETFNAFAGPKLWLGARGWYAGSSEQRDFYLKGSLDELRIWNSARSNMQLDIGRYAKLLGDEVGLIRYYPFEKFVSDAGILRVVEAEASLVGGEEQTPLQLQGATHSTNTPPVQLARPVSRLPFNFSANEDRIIISPNIDNALIENIILDITVKDIYDLHGNSLASPVTWSAYVDRNQVIWEEESRRFEISLGAPFDFKGKIRNNSGAVQQFNIHNTPDWLQVSPQSGTLSPLSSREITFTIQEGINIGRYIQDIYLRSDFGFDERLVLDLRVQQDPPSNWEIESSNYQFSMSIIGQIRIDGVLSRDEEDRISAFVGNKPRGSAQLQYIPTLNSYIAFLSIYSNQSSGEEISFRVWNASEGQIHSQVPPTHTFESNSLRGSINAPVIFDVPDFIEKEVTLEEGWQWLSFNLDDPDMSMVRNFMASVSASEGDIIKGMTYFDQYDPTLGWIGSLTKSGGLQLSENYKVNLKNPSRLRYEGEFVNPEDVSISLEQGWNWIGFTPQRRLSVEAAFSRLNPEVGDQVKSQLQFSVYAGGNAGWVGTLSSLQPGKGYMFYSGKDVDFTYPNTASTYTEASSSSARSLMSTVEVNPREHRDNMTLIVKVLDVDITSDHLLIAYIDGKERGISSFDSLGEDGWLAFLTVMGEGEEGDISFQIRDLPSQEITNLATERRIIFRQDDLLGTLKDPVIMRPIEMLASKGMLQLLPNPLSEDMTLILGHVQERLRRVELFAVNGERLAVINQENVRTLMRGYKIALSEWIGNYRDILIVRVYTDKNVYTRRAIRK